MCNCQKILLVIFLLSKLYLAIMVANVTQILLFYGRYFFFAVLQRLFQFMVAFGRMWWSTWHIENPLWAESVFPHVVLLRLVLILTPATSQMMQNVGCGWKVCRLYQPVWQVINLCPISVSCGIPAAKKLHCSLKS